MEGPLKKWVNLIYRWQTRYFILHDCVLIYCTKKGGEILGSLHLKISSIILVPEDPLRIIINSGTKEIILRAQNLQEKIDWMNALRNAQEEAFSKEEQYQQEQLFFGQECNLIQQNGKINGIYSLQNSQISSLQQSQYGDEKDKIKQMCLIYFNNSKLEKLNLALAQIWSTQAKFDETLSLIQPKIDKQSSIASALERVHSLGLQLKKQVTYCVKTQMEETKKLSVLSKQVENQALQQGYLDQSNHASKKIEQEMQDQSSKEIQNEIIIQCQPKLNFQTPQIQFNEQLFEQAESEEDELTEYQSFLEEYPQYHSSNTLLNLQQSNQSNLIPQYTLQQNQINEQNNQKYFHHHQQIFSNQEQIYKNELQNQDQIQLIQQPSFQLNITNQIVNDYKLLLEYLKVKDIYKYNLLTQNEFFKKHTLPIQPIRKQLDHFMDGVQQVSIWKIIKDMIGKDLARFSVPVFLNEPLSFLQRIAEQMEYSELLNTANAQPESCLRLAYVAAFIISEKPSVIDRIKKPFNPLLGETFEINYGIKDFRLISEQVSHHPPNFLQKKQSFGPKSYHWKAIFIQLINQNVLYRTYIDNFGDITITNHATGDLAIMSMKLRGWLEKNPYQVDGVIKDKSGIVKYKIIGKWNSYLSIIEIQTQKQLELWKRRDPIENHLYQYEFTHFGLQLNYLNCDLAAKIASTDSRFRPDQRALEMQQLDLAVKEKHRLEEKQRARRKEYEKLNKKHEPRWFMLKVDEITGQEYYQYKGGYWETRMSGNFKDLLDIY